MTEDEIQRQAARMARVHAEYLLCHAQDLPQDLALSQAIGLIRDYVSHLNQPYPALRFALAFHPIVEQWAMWAAWASALDLLLPLCSTMGTPQEHIQLLNCRSQAAREIADTQTALAVATLAVQQAECLQDQLMLAAALNKLGLVTFARDAISAAQTHWERAYELGHATLPAVELGHITMNLGTIAVRQGRFKDAERYFSEAFNHYRAQSNPLHIAKVQCNIADLQNRAGQLTSIPAMLLEARATLKTLGAQYEYGLAENDIGCIALKLQRLEAAEAAFDAALRVFERIGAMTARARVLSNVVTLLIARGDLSRAEQIADAARELAMTCHKPLLVATIDVDRGQIYAAQGERDRARRILIEAREAQVAHGAPLAAQETQRMIDALGPE